MAGSEEKLTRGVAIRTTKEWRKDGVPSHVVVRFLALGERAGPIAAAEPRDPLNAAALAKAALPAVATRLLAQVTKGLERLAVEDKRKFLRIIGAVEMMMSPGTGPQLPVAGEPRPEYDLERAPTIGSRKTARVGRRP